MTQFVPYKVGDRWTIDADPDDELDYLWVLTQWMLDNSTTGVSFELIPQGVTILEQAPIQGDMGDLVAAKLKVTYSEGDEAFVTARTRTADEQQFDKTIWFNKVEN